MTNKQKLFILEYIRDFNASRAAVAAGYSKKTARKIGQENLTKPDIQAAIQQAIEERAERLGRDADDVLRTLWESLEVDPLEYLIVEPDGSIRPKPLEEIKPELRQLLIKLKARSRITESADGTKIIREDELDLSLISKERVLELLAKHHGLLIYKHESEMKVVILKPDHSIKKHPDSGTGSSGTKN